ncbi:MAG TPA: class I SAM-dependent methyltransferase [Gemmatimonadales bacterium]|nr:class I SAM-dependent methyltransferase [Gemmatimonadales bacterium]
MNRAAAGPAKSAPGRSAPYVPALGSRRLTALYDPLMRWSMREQTFKRALVEQAGLADGQVVLDLGCGTGTLTVLVKQRAPGAVVTGVDIDPEALRIAGAKIGPTGLTIRLDRARASALPYPDGRYDRVVSSLVFHHLSPEEKRQTAAEVFRVLRPGGELHVADWGRPQNRLLRVAFLLVQLVDGFANTAEHARGALPDRLRGAGFSDVAVTRQFATVFGTLALLRARRPLPEAGTKGD